MVGRWYTWYGGIHVLMAVSGSTRGGAWGRRRARVARGEKRLPLPISRGRLTKPASAALRARAAVTSSQLTSVLARPRRRCVLSRDAPVLPGLHVKYIFHIFQINPQRRHIIFHERAMRSQYMYMSCRSRSHTCTRGQSCMHCTRERAYMSTLPLPFSPIAAFTAALPPPPRPRLTASQTA